MHGSRKWTYTSTFLLVLLLLLLAGQGSAWGTTKTVTYTMTSHEMNGGTSSYIIVFTRSGDTPFDTSAPNTYSATVNRSYFGQTTGGQGGFSVELADGFGLSFSWSEGSDVNFINNCVYARASGKTITYGFWSSDDNYYYVTHFTLTGSEGPWTDLDIPVNQQWHFNRLTAAAHSLGSVTVTYTDVPDISIVERADIGSVRYNSSLGVYEINCADNLHDLAVYVNGTGDYTTGGSETTSHTCSDLIFKMTADITIPHNTAWNDGSSTEDNYTPIGSAYLGNYMNEHISVPFSGTFDGDGHTVSGIRIYKGGTDINSTYKGIIGVVKNGTVQNVTIADARITGFSNIGGIVGYNKDGIVSNCHATATVAFRTIRNSAYSTGGIVGYNTYDNSSSPHSTVSGCTSAAIFSIASGVVTSTCGGFGGIVGINGEGCTISNCTAAGVILPNLNSNNGGAGAIVGKNDYDGILTNNKYHSCLMGDTYAFNIGVGANYIASSYYNEGDVSGGATLVTTKLWLYDDRSNTKLTTAYSRPYSHDNSSTAHGGSYPSVTNVNLTLKGRTFYKDGTWNTLALPFRIESPNSSNCPLNGATILTLDMDNTVYDSGTGALTVAFKSASSISMQTPYIVKWTGGSDITDPTFSNVGAGGLTTYTQAVTAGLVKFSSTFAPLSSTDGKLFDIHNSDNRGYHSYMTIEAPALPDGYVFTGWNTAADLSGTPVMGTIPFGPDGTFTLYAQRFDNTITAHLHDGYFWTTFYHESLNYQLPAGAQAYTMDGEHHLYRVGTDGSVAPAGMAVVIIADASALSDVTAGNGTLTLTYLASPAAESMVDHAPDYVNSSPTGGNILRGSDSPVFVSSISGTPHVLGVVGEVFGFHPYGGASIPANKAYYLTTQ